MNDHLPWPDGSRRAPAGCRLCVTVPAKDEATYIETTLRALHRQIDERERPLDATLYEVIVLANNCSDDTAERIRLYASRHPDFNLFVAERQLPPARACVGTARRLMMDAAARRLPPDGIICTTDADTRVDEQWVGATLRAFDRGARAVGGRIIVPTAERRDQSRRTHLQDVTYRSLQSCLEAMVDPDDDDPWPRHFQSFGPSTAVRVDAYLACGGLPRLACLEDVALIDALERIDVTIVHDPAVKVYTSDRRSQRVSGTAYSHQLDTWDSMQRQGRQPAVGSLHRCLQLYKWKVALRRAFHERRIGRSPALLDLVDFLGITAADLERSIGEAASFGALYQSIRHAVWRQDAYSDTNFAEAIRELRRFTHSLRTTPRGGTTRQGGNAPPAPRGDDKRHSLVPS